jgi:hypothetical protein
VLFKLSDIIVVDGVEVIRFNKERFLDEQKRGFPGFLEWNREMLGHVRLFRS